MPLTNGTGGCWDRAMNDSAEPGLVLRTATEGDLSALRHVYRAASLSNAGDAPMLLARPEFLVFAGDGIAEGRTLAAVSTSSDQADDQVVGFATIAAAHDGELELEDLFVDPGWRRRGIARQLVRRIAENARDTAHRRLWVTGNPHALDFYVAVGFVHTDDVTTELGTGLRMCLDLTRN